MSKESTDRDAAIKPAPVVALLTIDPKTIARP
jgi:hypothetical protein